jgi:hypothetical protein
VTMRFEDPAADFIPAVQRVFGMVEVEGDIEAAVRAAKEKLTDVG